MANAKLAQDIVQAAVARASRELPGFPTQTSGDVLLFGSAGALLDSLSLVSFVFILEDEFKRVSGQTLKVTTQDVLVSHRAPFRSLQTLTEFIMQKLQHD
jgi:hypothetical protein